MISFCVVSERQGALSFIECHWLRMRQKIVGREEEGGRSSRHALGGSDQSECLEVVTD